MLYALLLPLVGHWIGAVLSNNETNTYNLKIYFKFMKRIYALRGIVFRSGIKTKLNKMEVKKMSKEKKELIKKFKSVIDDLMDHYEEYNDQVRH